MAKTLTEQPRFLGPSSLDPVQVGDGAPMHSHVVHDLFLELNNRETYGEPSFQFLHSIACSTDGTPLLSTAPGSTSYQVAAPGGGDGTCFLGQAPILVPIDAVRLCWSLGFYRGVSGVEAAIDINVTNIVMYLASAPVMHLADVTTPSPNKENGRLFLPSFISGPYSSNTVVAVGGSAGTPIPYCYTKVQSETWTNFAPRGLQNINARNTEPNAFLIVTADITNGITGNTVRLGELSVWGQYE